MPISPGSPAPLLTLPSHEMQQVALGDLYAAGTTVFSFFPLAFSSTCTEQVCAFRDDLAEYERLDAQVVGISVDSPYVLRRFREEIGASYLFLSDFNREAATAFGVLRPVPVGPGLLNASERAVIVVDGEGVVRHVWCDPNPSLLPPFDEIRESVAALSRGAGKPG
jgi:glutaredoxin-dependent peroxiredoxin